MLILWDKLRTENLTYIFTRRLCQDQNCQPDLENILNLNFMPERKYTISGSSTSSSGAVNNLSLQDCDYRFHNIEKFDIRAVIQ